MTALLLACGIDPQKSVLFQQSSVPQHSELCWYLGCICTMARLAHLPQFKEKSASLKDIPLGLFVYPVLQAADIMLHKATHIPVGEDQLQHLQLTQELTRMFNKRFGITFPKVDAIIAGKCYPSMYWLSWQVHLLNIKMLFRKHTETIYHINNVNYYF